MLEKVVLRGAENSDWLIFEKPVEVFTATTSARVLPVLVEAEKKAAEADLFVAGFVSYEAAPGFDQAYQTHSLTEFPLVCVGLFLKPQISRHLPTYEGPAQPAPAWTMGELASDYAEKIAEIKRQIELGNTYQVNYTIRQVADIGEPWQLFQEIATDVAYAAYVEFEDHAIVCASPELFFELSGTQVSCKPMKGTAPRGMTTADDLSMRDQLRHSVKNRAENVMITDMLRNDLGRIAEPGSVQATGLFEVEKLKTVWQMTSTVNATTTATVAEIFTALFPCASVTGAPKIASMAVIADLEDTARGIYTGAIGYFGPDRQARFNVAIRTASVNKTTHQAVYGIGGGIVWDSEPADEYAECMSKARILAAPHADSQDFGLLETMLWTPEDEIFLVGEHLERLQASASYFDFDVDLTEIQSTLAKLGERLAPHPHRIRLLLRSDGRFRIAESRYVPNRASIRLAVAAAPIDRHDPFIYHKTTRRDVYDNAVRGLDADDALLWNRDGYITETTIANVMVRLDGVLYTPPIECGLLAGTYRAHLLKRGQVEERRIRIDEITPSTEVTLINSVRGAYPATLELPS